MTHATITAHSHLHCVVEFAFNEQAKNTVKALPGSNFNGDCWLVGIMHLPTLKGIFTKLDVDSAVIVAYHDLLKRMLCDLMGHEDDKAVRELLTKHANGIAAVRATGWQPTKVEHKRYVKPQPIAGPVEAQDAGVDLWLRGVKNAQAAEEVKGYVAKRKAKVTA